MPLSREMPIVPASSGRRYSSTYGSSSGYSSYRSASTSSYLSRNSSLERRYSDYSTTPYTSSTSSYLSRYSSSRPPGLPTSSSSSRTSPVRSAYSRQVSDSVSDSRYSSLGRDSGYSSRYSSNRDVSNGDSTVSRFGPTNASYASRYRWNRYDDDYEEEEEDYSKSSKQPEKLRLSDKLRSYESSTSSPTKTSTEPYSWRRWLEKTPPKDTYKSANITSKVSEERSPEPSCSSLRADKKTTYLRTKRASNFLENGTKLDVDDSSSVTSDSSGYRSPARARSGSNAKKREESPVRRQRADSPSTKNKSKEKTDYRLGTSSTRTKTRSKSPAVQTDAATDSASELSSTGSRRRTDSSSSTANKTAADSIVIQVDAPEKFERKSAKAYDVSDSLSSIGSKLKSSSDNRKLATSALANGGDASCVSYGGVSERGSSSSSSRLAAGRAAAAIDDVSSVSPSGRRLRASERAAERARIRLEQELKSEAKAEIEDGGTGEFSEESGLTGLRNIGNTCFMNSVLQCLSNTRCLLQFVVKENFAMDVNSTTSTMKGDLIKAFATLIKDMWADGASNRAITTSPFKSQVQRFAPAFSGYQQHDAQEFLRKLIEGLHEDVNRVIARPKPILTDIDDDLSDSQKATESWKRYLRFDDSKIVEMFVGQLKSTLKCSTCNHCSVTFDPFWDLSLPIPSRSGQVQLTQCLDLFTKEEILDGDEKPTCSACKTRRKCSKSFSLQKFPRILVLHLKRFSPMERWRGKLSCTVDFPLAQLDLSNYAADRSTACTYDLIGVANHSGTTYSGHYTAYCKHPYTAQWHEYNDSRVSSITNRRVCSPEAYLLFYELQSNSKL